MRNLIIVAVEYHFTGEDLILLCFINIFQNPAAKQKKNPQLDFDDSDSD